MLKQRHRLFVTLIRVSDIACITAACTLAMVMRPGHSFSAVLADPVESFRASYAPLVVPITFCVMLMTGLYRPRRDEHPLREIGALARSVALALLVLIASLWLLSGPDPLAPELGAFLLGETHAAQTDRTQIVMIATLVFLVLSLERACLRVTLRSMRRTGWNNRFAAVVGVGRLGQITARTLERNTWTGIRVSYFISHHETTNRTRCLDRPVHGGLDDLERVLEQHPVDAVYLSLPNVLASEVPKILQRLERYAVDVRLIPDVRPKHLPQSMRVSEIEGMPVLSYRESPMAGIGAVTKRGIDLVGASLGIIATSPVLLLIAAATYLSSRGPVIFKQKRVSLGGEEFWIYKFRTMIIDEDAGEGGWTTRNDPRITRLGKLLRRTSLDELPQLFNVFVGDMSLVGPRPERVELISQFRDDWRGYMLRQHAKAGMTGWAQVNGLRGDTCLKKRLQYDLYYIRNWSVGFDLWILLLTPFRGFVHRNAY